jgi:hypothetical protein
VKVECNTCASQRSENPEQQSKICIYIKEDIKGEKRSGMNSVLYSLYQVGDGEFDKVASCFESSWSRVKLRAPCAPNACSALYVSVHACEFEEEGEQGCGINAR